MNQQRVTQYRLSSLLVVASGMLGACAGVPESKAPIPAPAVIAQ